MLLLIYVEADNTSQKSQKEKKTISQKWDTVIVKFTNEI